MTNAKGVLEWMEWKEREKKLKENMTNKEYIRTCSTEELADVIADFYLLGFTHGHNQMDITSRTKWAEWLKQPRREE